MTRRNARSDRTSGRAYSPDAPENRHGMPAMLSARRIASAWAFARTRTAWSRGAAPASIRRPISAAIQSASSDPDAKASRRTGAGRGLTRWARNRLLTPARTSRRSGSLKRMSRWEASRIGASDR